MRNAVKIITGQMKPSSLENVPRSDAVDPAPLSDQMSSNSTTISEPDPRVGFPIEQIELSYAGPCDVIHGRQDSAWAPREAFHDDSNIGLCNAIDASSLDQAKVEGRISLLFLRLGDTVEVPAGSTTDRVAPTPPYPSANVKPPAEGDEMTRSMQAKLEKAIEVEQARQVSQEAVRCQYQKLLVIEHGRLRSANEQYRLLCDKSLTSGEDVVSDCNICKEQERNAQGIQGELAALQHYVKAAKKLALVEVVEEHLRIDENLKRISDYAACLEMSSRQHYEACLEATAERRRKVFQLLVVRRGGIQILARPNNGELCDDIKFHTAEGVVRFAAKAGKVAKEYPFDRVFSPADSNGVLWSDEIQPLVENAFNGLSITLFAYGQTGSGKTYTMCERGDSMIQKTIQRVFEEKEQVDAAGGSLDVEFSAVEIYQDKIFTLCNNKREEVMIRKDKHGCYQAFIKADIKGTRGSDVPDRLPVPTVAVATAGVCLDVFRNAAKLRLTRDMVQFGGHNTASSRSHLVCTLRLVMWNVHHKDTRACIQLVDLAGTEEVVTGANDAYSNKQQEIKDAQSEGKAIGTSLFKLTSLVQNIRKNSAAQQQGSLKAIVIRDSDWNACAITQVLRQGLSGDTPLIAFIATLHTCNVHEGHRTCQRAVQLTEQLKL